MTLHDAQRRLADAISIVRHARRTLVLLGVPPLAWRCPRLRLGRGEPPARRRSGARSLPCPYRLTSMPRCRSDSLAGRLMIVNPRPRNANRFADDRLWDDTGREWSRCGRAISLVRRSSTRLPTLRSESACTMTSARPLRWIDSDQRVSSLARLLSPATLPMAGCARNTRASGAGCRMWPDFGIATARPAGLRERLT